MFAGLAAAARDAFEALLEIREPLPWDPPQGGRWYVRLRPHDTREFAALRATLKIEPATSLQRQQRLSDDAAKKAKKADASSALSALQDIGRTIERGVIEEKAVELGFPADRPFYIPDEVDRLRGGVARCLVVAVEREVDGQVVESTSGPDAQPAFLSDAPIPYRLEVDDKRLPYHGQPEGRVLSAFCLRLSMEDERFRRRLDPLPPSSPTPQPGEAEPPSRIESESA